MFSINALHKETAHSELQEFLERQPFLPLFFFSPYTLVTWLFNQDRELHIAKYNDEEVLLVHKKNTNEVRVLFSYPSNEMKEALVTCFAPSYFAVNEATTPPLGDEPFKEGEDLLLTIKDIANLEDKEIKRKYRQCTTNHPQLQFIPYTSEYVEKIAEFVKAWNVARTEEQNKHAKTENDLNFIELYKEDPNLMGGIVLDGEKVIAITFAVPALDGNAVGPISKCLRGYTQLGLFTFVERAKVLAERGIQQLYIGGINNDFKKQFLKSTTINPVYTCELGKDETKDFPEHHVWKVFS